MMLNSKCIWSTRIHQSCNIFCFVVCARDSFLGGSSYRLQYNILYIYIYIHVDIYKLKFPS